VHQIRVAITRLRAAVSFFAPMTVDTEWPRLSKEIAWLNASLGAARDSDVMVDYAGRKRYRAWAQRMIGQGLDQRRLRDHRLLVRCLRAPRFRRLTEAISGWLRRGPWLERWKKIARRNGAAPLQACCEHKLDRWRLRLIRKGRHLKTMNASRRHRVRIKAKGFRYMLEAMTDIGVAHSSGAYRHLHRPAKRLQRALGDLRDLRRFARLAAGLSGVADGERRPPGYRRQKDKLLGAAVEAYRDLRRAGV
jgi:CHAD domain-containing protein